MWFELKGVVDVKMAGWKGTYKHVLKLEVVGDARVGKTCLAARFGEANFLERYHPTMGKETRKMAYCSNALRWAGPPGVQVPYLLALPTCLSP